MLELGSACEAGRGVSVDTIGDLRSEASQRVVGDSGKVHNGFKALEVTGLDIPNIFDNRRNLRRRRPELTSGEKVGIQARDVMPLGGQHACQY